MSTYLEAQFGFGVESTVGTRVAPTRFLPILSETLSHGIDTLESQSYRSGRKTKTVRRQGAQRVLGDVDMELSPQGLGLWLKQAFGNNVDSGANPYAHTLTPAGLVGKAVSIQVGRVDQGGTMRPFDYIGCKITKWTIDAEINKLATLKCSIWGMDEDTGQSLASATYPTGLAPFSFIDGSLTIGGTAVPVKSVQLTGDNGLMVDRQRIQSTNPGVAREAIETAIRNYGGQLTADFVDLTAYNRFVNQTQATLVTTFDNGAAAKLVITQTVEFDGTTPNASGMGNEIDQPLPFTAINATSDANVITAVLTNADATP
jgi:hypothetical protein